MPLPDWFNLGYLAIGGPRQRAAHAALGRLGVMRRLAAHDPCLVGTIPLDVDRPGSDLDIICEANDQDAFERSLREAFGRRPDFALGRGRIDGLPVVVCGFTADGFPIEVFGQARPVREQNGYRHLVAEARLLDLAGDAARPAIRRLKAIGLKTEPAFATHFCLAGDPYAAVLALAEASDADLNAVIRRAAETRASCVFCRILDGGEPASLVYEDAQTIAFMDLRQPNPGKTLVIPRRHAETIDALDEATAASLGQTVVRVARAVQRAFAPPGLTLQQFNGAVAGQDVPHVHVHIIPRWEGDGLQSLYRELPPTSDRPTLDALAERIRAFRDM
jgi:diadenosine tetraphosphate (Ap4A) HIT family hydrolase